MTIPFDGEALDYDASFTYTPVGQLQRARVWRYLEKILPDLKGRKVLELNCGSGEDACRLGSVGYEVLATDVSSKMLKVTKTKIDSKKIGALVTARQLDFKEIHQLKGNKFDLVFSNFGGLNCIDQNALGHLLREVAALLNPGGRFIAVIMPKFCLTEIVYFILRFKIGKAFRRLRSNNVALLQDATVPVWYYSPRSLRQLASPYFVKSRLQPVGLLIPPSYLNNAFKKRGSVLNFLASVENRIGNFQWLSNFSDHFLIDLTLR